MPGEGRRKTYELDDYSLAQYAEWAYALTVHKSQGSECKVVALLLHPKARFMYTRNLVYTAITRASQELLIFGELGILQDALARVETRITTLGLLLNDSKLCDRIMARTMVADLSDYASEYL